jgi:hypothetical protein
MGFIPAGGVRVGFEAKKSRRLLNVRVAQQRTDRDEPHLFSSPSGDAVVDVELPQTASGPTTHAEISRICVKVLTLLCGIAGRENVPQIADQ